VEKTVIAGNHLVTAANVALSAAIYPKTAGEIILCQHERIGCVILAGSYST
jgi:hypothetical protein